MLENKEYDFLPGKQIYTLRCSGCGNKKDYKSLNGFMPLADISDPTKLKMLVGDCQECKGQHYFYFSNVRDISFKNRENKMLENVEKDKLLLMIEEIKHQVAMGHFLNAHFRAFEVSNEAWKEHIRVNARIGAEKVNSPGGAVLDNDRDGRIKSIMEK